ncbi:MAG: hypothetical protein ACE5G2_05710 [Candidatus Krumholzibacteriia bacterium]
MAKRRDPAVTATIMASVRDRDSKAEVALRNAVHARGYRYALRSKSVPGKPDIVFPGRRVAVSPPRDLPGARPACGLDLRSSGGGQDPPSSPLAHRTATAGCGRPRVWTGASLRGSVPGCDRIARDGSHRGPRDRGRRQTRVAHVAPGLDPSPPSIGRPRRPPALSSSSTPPPLQGCGGMLLRSCRKSRG